MARPPLLQLSSVSLGENQKYLFNDLSLKVHPGDRIALVGRNGSGKSTLMKLMAGLITPDRGSLSTGPGVSVGYLAQDPNLAHFTTLRAYASSNLPSEQAYKVDIFAEDLKLNLNADAKTASGGEQRRAALVKLLAEDPDLMLLDEPTNHLDISAISWLETTLLENRKSFILISHDRAFLTALTTSTLWIDRGQARQHSKGFAHFEAWRDKTWEEEELARHKLDRKIKSEARWAVEGISARRKRNMGRMRALEELRNTRKDMIAQPGKAALALSSGQISGHRVIEAKKISKSYGDRIIFKDVSLKITRGERIAFVGPNGVGKTTLLKVLMGDIKPDTGTVQLGTNLNSAVFDQARAQFDPDASLWDSLANDPLLGMNGQSDQIIVRGKARHVAGYLKDFLFPADALHAPVKSLSGGEKARLLLARIMALSSNLLVLDEPTNDLDIETLDLLQDVLAEYQGTVLLVSHDRDFLDRVATKTIAFEGAGQIGVYAGGWSDYVLQKSSHEPVIVKKAKTPPKISLSPKNIATSGLSFTEKHRLKELPDLIAGTEKEIEKLETLLSDPDLFSKTPEKFYKATQALTSRVALLDNLETEWFTLAEKEELEK